MRAMVSPITSLMILNSRRRSKKTSKLCVIGLCVVTGGFPAQRVSYAENVSIWWRHHVSLMFLSQWDTVCDDAYMVSTSQTILTGGFLLGAFLLSPVVDRYGRKRVMICSILIISALEFCAAWVQHYWLFCVFKFCIGFAQQVKNSITSNPLYTTSQIPKLECFSSRLAVLFAQSIEARC